MIKSYYRSPYVQKGYGLGSIFRSVAKFFRPIARNITRTMNSPKVKNVLKTVGKETINTGSELLIDSIKGNDIESKLDKRIKTAKQRIVDSIQDGINISKRANESRKYKRLYDNEHLSKASNNYTKRRVPNKIRKLSSKQRRVKTANRTVFD